MEPRIQYAKTSDGVSIAYAVFGDGPPIVNVSTFPGGVHLYSHLALSRRSVDQLVALGWQVIRYDERGSGSSDREVSDFSLEARLLDLETVVDRLGLERFTLYGALAAAQVAIAYTARHPERVSHLVLRDPLAPGKEYFESDATRRVIKAMRPLFEEYWELMTLNIAYLMMGFTDSDVANEWAAVLRSGTSARAFAARDEAIERTDVTRELDSMRAPTLVIHSAGVSAMDLASLLPLARKVAASIPDARLVTTGDVAAVVDEFLREGEPAGAAPALPSGTAVILFADIAESIALTERLGDAAFRERARGLDGALRGVIRENGGTPVEGRLLGDGVLAVFTSARQAIEAALACGGAGNEAGLPLHLGLHAGDVIREEGNVYGGAVNIAARISALSSPGELLVSDTLRGLARTSAGVSFDDRGERELKGVGEPVRVWAILRQAQDEREAG